LLARFCPLTLRWRESSEEFVLVSKTTAKRPTAAVQPATRPGTKKAPAKADEPSGREAVLTAAEKLAAAIRGGDKAAAEKLLARDFAFIDASGSVHPRRDVLANLKPGPDSPSPRVKVKTYGRVALVTGASKSGQGRQRNDLFGLDVWVNGTDGWKALLHHNNVLAPPDASPMHPASQPRSAGAAPPECRNPLQVVPYQPKSQAEREVIKAFQIMETAVTHNDPDEWAKHVADEFTVYRTNQRPTTKAARIGFIETQQQINAETFVAEIEWMKLWVFGDTVVMRADHVMPGDRRPPYRATRIWVKRDGRWQMAVSQQTTISA
jgi:ketosteroid isomerase-like protein